MNVDAILMEMAYIAMEVGDTFMECDENFDVWPMFTCGGNFDCNRDQKLPWKYVAPVSVDRNCHQLRSTFVNIDQTPDFSNTFFIQLSTQFQPSPHMTGKRVLDTVRFSGLQAYISKRAHDGEIFSLKFIVLRRSPRTLHHIRSTVTIG